MTDDRNHPRPPSAPDPSGVIDAPFTQIGQDELRLNQPGGFATRTVRNGAATVVGNLWAVLVGAVALPVTLDGLGVEAFGVWVLLLSFSAVNGWLSLADLGLRTAAVRAVAAPLARGDREAADRALGATARAVVPIALGAGLLMAGVGRVALPALFHVPDPLRDATRVATTWFALQAAIELLLLLPHVALEGAQRIDRSRAVHALRLTAVQVTAAVVATRTGSLAATARAAAIATLAAAVAAVVVMLRTTASRPRRPEPGAARHLIGYGARVGAINLTGVLHRTMDRAVVGATFGPREVVLVEIATQLANGAQTLLGAAHALTAAAPWVHARDDREGLRALLVRGTRLTTLATVPGLVVAAVLARPIVDVWLGSDQRAAAGLAVVAVLGVAWAVPAQTASLLLQSTGHAAAVLRPATIAVVANLVLSIVLAHALGVVGVFVATVITAAGLLVPLVAPALRLTATSVGDFVREALVPITLPVLATVGAAACGLLATTPLVELGVGTALALVAWVLTAAFALEDDDRATLRRAIGRDLPTT